MSQLFPSFIIIGERKCGTSSLYRYLLDHPQVLPAKQKETAFFSHSASFIRRNFPQYLEYFPKETDQRATMQWLDLNAQGELFTKELSFGIEKDIDYITGEASANVFSTVHPGKLKRYLPSIKLVVMMREPISRAVSQHQMYERYKTEGRSWSWLLGTKERDFRLEWMALQMNINKGPFLSPGRYFRNLNRWLKYFPASQFFFIRTEDLLDKSLAAQVLKELIEFLDLENHSFGDILNQRFNRAPPEDQELFASDYLKEFYSKENQLMEKYLNRKLWSYEF